MSQAFFGTPARVYSGIELRRSTRIERTVPLFISGRDTGGQDFLERTSAVSVNLHGCRYPSRHDLRVGSWITLQLGESTIGEISGSGLKSSFAAGRKCELKRVFGYGIHQSEPQSLRGMQFFRS